MPVPVAEGLNEAKIRKAAADLGIPEQADQVVHMFTKVYECFMARDCDMVEINPLVLTKDNKVLAADSKINVTAVVISGSNNTTACD